METQLNAFENAIKTYLDNRASTDELFAKVYAKKGKSFKDCINYIYTEVQKSKRQGFADEEIYSMAVHYYDEDNLEINRKLNPIVVSNQSIELSEEDKKQELVKLQKDAPKVEIEKPKQEKPKQQAKPLPINQPSLFDML